MASYLLKASDEDMGRWKANAAGLGISFAQYVRVRLDASPDVPGLVMTSSGFDARLSGATGQPAPQARPRPKLVRSKTEKCPHGNPPDRYCSRCKA